MKKILFLLFAISIMGLACKTNKTQIASSKDFVGAWKHSYEDEKDNNKVYRPDTYTFGPSRGRTSLTISEDGTCWKTGIAPTDGFIKYTGKWDFNKKKNTISFTWTDAEKGALEKLTEKTETFVIVSATKEMLTMKKEAK